MSADATTTADGFRVGRRVRVIDGGSPDQGQCGSLVPRKDNPPGFGWWHIKFDGRVLDRGASYHQSILQALPEPDAPATPEPPADKPSMGQMLMDILDHLHEPSGPTPDSKPDHYAALRDAGCEPWDVMAAAYPADWCLAYNVGTALVYLQRCKLKHPTPDDDIRKAHAHLAEAVKILDSKPNPTNT